MICFGIEFYLDLQLSTVYLACQVGCICNDTVKIASCIMLPLANIMRLHQFMMIML